MYCIWASSTCALPSRLFACWAKMSRISAVRSMTLTLTTSSSLRSWPGVSSPSQIDGVGAGRRRRCRAARRPCPSRCRSRGRAGRAAGPAPSSTCGAGGLGERRQLGQRVLRVVRRCPRVQTPTSTTRSSRSWRYSTSVTSCELGGQPGDPAQRLRGRRRSSCSPSNRSSVSASSNCSEVSGSRVHGCLRSSRAVQHPALAESSPSEWHERGISAPRLALQALRPPTGSPASRRRRAARTRSVPPPRSGPSRPGRRSRW